MVNTSVNNFHLKLSIITINYNNCKGLEKTFQSVFNQSTKNIEYIIIDGGSTDGSYELIKSNASRLGYFVSEKDNGIYHAMNKGIAKATGDYLLFINSGDLLANETVVEKMLDGEGGKIDLIYGDLKMIYPDGTVTISKMPDFLTVDHMMERTLFHPVTLIHRRLFSEYGYYDERLKIVADWAFFLKIIVLGTVSSKHKEIVVSEYTMDGISSQESNLEKIVQEGRWVKANYLSQAFRSHYEEYKIYKQFYHHKWVARARKLAAKFGYSI